MSHESQIKHYRMLESEVATAQQKLKQKIDDMDLFRCEIAGITVGDIVKVADGSLARVCRVDTHWVTPTRDGFGRPWVSVNLMKKNGDWSEAIRNAYDNWEFVERGTTLTGT